MGYFNEYLNELESIYKIKYNKQVLDEIDKQKVLAYFNEKIKPRYKAKKIKISNTTLQYHDEPVKEVDFVSLYDQCREQNCTFSLSHGVFKDEKSQILEIWDEQMIRRNEFKNKMKDMLKENNTVMANLYNNYQKIFKENANAMYGSFGESSFVFYDVNNISNLTGTCYYVLLSTINEIEKVIGGRVLLRDSQELFDYLVYLNNKNISRYSELIIPELKEKLEEHISDKDVEEICSIIKSYCQFQVNDKIYDIIKNTIENVFKSNDIAKKLLFKYNCKFLKFIKDTNLFDYMIRLDFENFVSNKYNEHQFSEKNNNVKELLELLVFDDYLQSDLLDLADNYKRSTVMLSDTDSTFCVSNEIFNEIMSSFINICNENNIKFDSDLDYKTHSFKIIMFIGSAMSDYFLKTIAGEKYQNSKDNRWKLKSEFLYNKILLMKVKKTYIGSILSQEGIRLTPMKLDNKNTELVRSRYNFITKDFLKDFYNVLIMDESKDIDVKSLLDVVDNYNDKFDSISKDYLECSKLGTRSEFKLTTAYKNDPFTVYQYKACATFNCLFPEYKTLPGDKVSLMPVSAVPAFKYESIVNLEELLSKLNSNPSDIDKVRKKFKSEMVDLVKFNEYVVKEQLNSIVLDKKYMSTIQTLLNEERDKKLKEWYISSYGKNEDLKNRFIDLFNRPNKSEFELKTIEMLMKDAGINYLAFSYYDSMPETMLDIIDINTIKLESIYDRTIRIFDALNIKVYQKSDQKNYLTNILEL